ncbi:unnamed protein product [Darwinula stevensoni]|uniref:Glutamate-gated chloride channel n=1 Tax=Darwinula stevensoni TaxID=69355 RepID=A0A7R8X523_9CRUS|nr:unnamed protein product [Darwinula stevensoni]CAG0885570.1 unnamed protein product [Darwinula stevensoni]
MCQEKPISILKVPRPLHPAMAVAFRIARDAGANFITATWVATHLHRSESWVAQNWNKDPMWKRGSRIEWERGSHIEREGSSPRKPCRKCRNRIKGLRLTEEDEKRFFDGPTVVVVNYYVRRIAGLDDGDMEYKVQLTFRQQWTDERLKFDDVGGKIKYLTMTDPSRLWIPDLFFQNEIEGKFHNVILPNVFVRIFPEGKILYSIRVSLTLSCLMDLTLFPLDRQTCQIRIASYGWTTEDMVLLWKDGDPVQISKSLNLRRFNLEEFNTGYCNSKTNTGEYSCLRTDLVFEREFNYYLIHVYIPSCMMVIVSWLPFWLDRRTVVGRVGLEVIVLFTMAMQVTFINASFPSVSYTRAVDVWTGMCLTFVFFALLESVLVSHASKSRGHRNRDHTELESVPFEVQQPKATAKGRISIWLDRVHSRPSKVDAISRIAFPVCFALFNVGYWAGYL